MKLGGAHAPGAPQVPMPMLSLYGMLECQLRCELLLLVNMAHMGCLVCRIIIVGQCACKEFVVCAWLGKIAQDEARNCVKVLWCHSVL